MNSFRCRVVLHSDLTLLRETKHYFSSFSIVLWCDKFSDYGDINNFFSSSRFNLQNMAGCCVLNNDGCGKLFSYWKWRVTRESASAFRNKFGELQFLTGMGWLVATIVVTDEVCVVPWHPQTANALAVMKSQTAARGLVQNPLTFSLIFRKQVKETRPAIFLHLTTLSAYGRTN